MTSRKMPPGFLLSLNPTSYGICRNLRDAPFPLHMFHKGGGLEPFLSKDVKIHRISIDTEPEWAVKLLAAQCAGSGRPGIVFASSDTELAFLEKYRDELTPAASLPIQPPGIAAAVSDKLRFFETMRDLGIPSPRSYSIDAGSDSATFLPCLVKPVHSGEWKTEEASLALSGRKGFVANRHEEFAEIVRKVRPFSSKLLVQEIIESREGESYSYCCFSDRAGRVLWGFVTQKLLQFPAGFGTAILCGTADRPDIAAFGRKVVESIGLEGVSEVEILADRGGKLFAIEINARHWLQHRLSTRLGVNISLLDYYYRTGDSAMVEQFVSAPVRSGRYLWIDDFGYIAHFLKQVTRGGNLHLKSFSGSSLEFSLLERGKGLALVSLLRRRIGGR